MFFLQQYFDFQFFSCTRNIVTSDFETFSCEKTWFNKVFIFFPGDAAQLGGLKGTSLHLHLHLHSYTYIYTYTLCTLVHIHIHLHTQCTFSLTLTQSMHNNCSIFTKPLTQTVIIVIIICKGSLRPQIRMFFYLFQTGGNFRSK